jgi:peptide/nickel transport system substrate-binding protein
VTEAVAFIESKPIPGVEVVGDDTISFHLVAPVNDFVDVLAMPAASPVPFEALAYPPNSPEYLKNLISAGPYRLTDTKGGVYRFSRNQAWSTSSDGIRKALPDHFTIRAGLNQAAIQAAIEFGAADMALDAAVPIERAVALRARGDRRLTAADSGPSVLLTVGMNGPAAAALRELPVRQALVSCVDRAAVVTALGGPVVARPATQLLRSPMTGYTSQDPFPDAGSSGDLETCRTGLAHTPGGPVTALSLLTTDSPQDAAVANALRVAFARSGVRIDIRIRNGEGFARAAVSPNGQFWDLALTTITPAWYGDAGRTVYQPMLDATWVGDRPADGGYRSQAVTRRFNAALRATNEQAAKGNWEQFEWTVLRDAAIIPLAVTVTPRFHGSNVRSFTPVPSLGTADPTAVSLGPD